jgi:hypothetical protein
MTPPHPRPESRRESSYLTFTPRRSTIASFDNLVVLANYEEHLREARKMVWRDRGEPAVDIHDVHECLIHGARGGLRTVFFLPVAPPASSLTRLHPPALSRCCYHRLCHPVWRECSPTFGAYQEFPQVCLHPMSRRVAACSNIIIIAGRGVCLSYDTYSLVQILSARLLC